MAAWVVDQEREVARRRSLTDDQVQMARCMKDARASGLICLRLLLSASRAMDRRCPFVLG